MKRLIVLLVLVGVAVPTAIALATPSQRHSPKVTVYDGYKSSYPQLHSLFALTGKVVNTSTT